MLPRFLLPTHAVDETNPVFQKELRHVRWVSTKRGLKWCNIATFIGIPLVVMCGWLIEVTYLNPRLLMSRFETGILILAVAAISVMILSSLYSIPVVIGTFTAHLTSPYWDMLRLTPQSSSVIISAEDAIAQLRLWPLTAVEIGLRISLILWIVTSQFYRMYVNMGDVSAFLAEILHPFVWGFWLMLILTSLALFLEPILRTRLIITIHLALAARLRNLPFAGLASLFAVVLLHGAEIILTIITVHSIGFLARNPIELFIIICIVPLTVMMLVLGVIIYHWTRLAAFAITHDHAFKQD